MRAVAYHQPSTLFLALVAELRDIGLHLGLQCLGQHAAGLSRTISSINDNESDPPVGRGPSAAAAPVTAVSMGPTFPTGVGAPILLEGLQVIGRVRPLPLIHRSQALLQSSLTSHKLTVYSSSSYSRRS